MLRLISIVAGAAVTAGCADPVKFHYAHLRPIGVEVVEAGSLNLLRYEGDDIPLSYRAELEGREIEVLIVPEQGSLTAQLEIRAGALDSLASEVDQPQPEGCGYSGVREAGTVIWTFWSTVPELTGICFGEDARDASFTLRFAGGESDLTLRGRIKEAGKYADYRYGSP